MTIPDSVEIEINNKPQSYTIHAVIVRINRSVDALIRHRDCSMSLTPTYFVIFGETVQGQRFRPSDWAERLAGVLAPYRPAGVAGGHISFSPYVVPRQIDGVKAVVIDQRLRDIEPLAWKFVHDFAQDNQLKTATGALETIKRA